MSEKKGLYLSKIALAGCLIGGFSIILLVGLLCGFVARPKNCIQPTIKPTDSTTPPSIATNPSVTVSSSSQQSISSIRLKKSLK